MYITKNSYEEFSISCKNKATGQAVSNLASATEITFQLREYSGAVAMQLTLSAGEIEVNVPANGDIKINVPMVKTATIPAGNKLAGCQVQFSATDVREIELSENGMLIEIIEVREQSVV